MSRRVPPSVWVLRAVVLLGPLVALYSASPSGHTPSLFVGGVVAVASAGFAWKPEQFIGLITLSLVLVWWALVVGDAIPAGALVGAAAFLAAHVAATLLGYGPPETPVSAELVLLWVPRAAAVWLSALLVWLTARAYDGHATPALFWTSGLAAALAGAVVAAVVVPARATAGEDR